MDIGFIGLGNTGAPMARRLLEAGHKVVVYDTRQEAIGNLAALGAAAARSPAEVGDNAEIVMASLPTPDVVLNVATGQSGVIEGCAASSICRQRAQWWRNAFSTCCARATSCRSTAR